MRALEGSRRWNRWVPYTIVVFTALVLALGLAGAKTPWAQISGRVVYLAAVEMKGGQARGNHEGHLHGHQARSVPHYLRQTPTEHARRTLLILPK